MKSEPDVFSIDHLKKKARAPWDGVRNFQARNYMRDMKAGDMILFYHSSTNPPGVVGVARVSKEVFPDFTSWDKQSQYYDPRSSPEKPLWLMVEVEFIEKFPHLVSLDELRGTPSLKDMVVLKRGSRLSVQPTTEEEFEIIKRLGHS